MLRKLNQIYTPTISRNVMHVNLCIDLTLCRGCIKDLNCVRNKNGVPKIMLGNRN